MRDSESEDKSSSKTFIIRNMTKTKQQDEVLKEVKLEKIKPHYKMTKREQLADREWQRWHRIGYNQAIDDSEKLKDRL